MCTNPKNIEELYTKKGNQRCQAFSSKIASIRYFLRNPNRKITSSMNGISNTNKNSEPIAEDERSILCSSTTYLSNSAAAVRYTTNKSNFATKSVKNTSIYLISYQGNPVVFL